MSDSSSSWAKAVAFNKLHIPGDPVILPNAWDAVSANVIAAAGAAAIATSSAAVSWAYGRPDGNRLSRYEMIHAVARIVQAVELPVSADIESGYGADDGDLAVTLRGVLDAGIVGINLEDSGTGDPAAPLWPVDVAARRVQVARAAASERGVPMYLNARIDTFIAEAGAPEGRLEETLHRAAEYLAAGASGVFVPAVSDPHMIEQLVAGIEGPVNILVGPGSPPVAELAQLGVARISTGSSLAAAAFGFLHRAAAEVLAEGSYALLEGRIPYADLNAYFAVDPDALDAPNHFRR